MNRTTKSFDHIPALDGLRALAVLIVMVSHGGYGNIVPGGFGVTIFFFLSGYLITTLLRREFAKTNEIDFRGFYFRRAVRIIPPMHLAIVFTVLLSLLSLQPVTISYEYLHWDFLFLSNYAASFGASSWIKIPLWSLDVEEHFYMIFPLFYFVLASKISSRQIAIACAAICTVILGIRTMNLFILDDFSNNYYWSHTRIDSILFGCCLALYKNPASGGVDFFSNRWTSLYLAAILLVAGFVIRDPVFRETLRFTVQGIGLFFLFNFIIRDKGIIRKCLSSGIMRFVGLISYTLYLIHFPLFGAVDVLLPESSTIARLVIGSASSFLFAYAAYALMERPLLRWRKKVETGWREGRSVQTAKTG